MTLGDKQRLFTVLVGKLLIEIDRLGYACTFGAAFRSGKKERLHSRRLAIDLNLFKRDTDGDWLYCTETDDHIDLGVWWERQHELCSWGGRFNDPPDGNHYSLKHGGMR